MAETTTTEGNNRGQTRRSIESLEQHFQEMEARFRPATVLGEMKLAAAKAAVYAPVALGVGTALLFIGRKVFIRPV